MYDKFDAMWWTTTDVRWMGLIYNVEGVFSISLSHHESRHIGQERYQNQGNIIGLMLV